jgi:hypothetical protein
MRSSPQDDLVIGDQVADSTASYPAGAPLGAPGRDRWGINDDLTSVEQAEHVQLSSGMGRLEVEEESRFHNTEWRQSCLGNTFRQSSNVDGTRERTTPAARTKSTVVNRVSFGLPEQSEHSVSERSPNAGV